MRRRIVAGNWKMNGTVADLATVAEISTAAKTAACEVVLCLPATLIRSARNLVGMEIGGQDCHAQAEGAHTGDISAPMLRNAGAGWVILGHSERRRDHGESDAQVAAKVRAAILCIGETEAQYRAGDTLGVLAAQIAGSLPEGATPANTVIAYEPVWAIGTGLTPAPEEITRAHAFIRARLPDPSLSILYGGSVGPANAALLLALPDIDGALVGGASLKSESFIPIIHALETAHA
jgi:triosephosphate isomerase